jgi:hypothetical protein
MAENQGYASCIQYIPNSDGKSLVSVGVSGLYYSYDSGNFGNNWLLIRASYNPVH